MHDSVCTLYIAIQGHSDQTKLLVYTHGIIHSTCAITMSCIGCVYVHHVYTYMCLRVTPNVRWQKFLCCENKLQTRCLQANLALTVFQYQTRNRASQILTFIRSFDYWISRFTSLQRLFMIYLACYIVHSCIMVHGWQKKNNKRSQGHLYVDIKGVRGQYYTL